MISNIRIQNFRSYADASFEFEKGVNIIVGPNASGKTNILEAILMLAQGKSYRAKDEEMVMWHKPWARIDADIFGNERIVKIEKPKSADRFQKTFTIDGQKLSRLSLPKTVPTVLFEPNFIQLLTGSPELRRNFLDDLLSQTVVGYKSTLSKYKRALAQRNSLLKRGPQAAASQLFAWDIRLSELGSQIVANRQEVLERFNQTIESVYSELAHHTSKVRLDYKTACDPENYATSLLKKLSANTELDFLRGFTAYGPHRDDVTVELNGYSVQEGASRGETRTLLLALKVIELQIIEASRQEAPILLLDDVFSELDGARRRALAHYLKDYQAFITTTDADIVIKNFTKSSNVIAL